MPKPQLLLGNLALPICSGRFGVSHPDLNFSSSIGAQYFLNDCYTKALCKQQVLGNFPGSMLHYLYVKHHLVVKEGDHTSKSPRCVLHTLSFQRALNIMLDKKPWLLVCRRPYFQKLIFLEWMFPALSPPPYFLPSLVLNPFLLHYNWFIETQFQLAFVLFWLPQEHPDFLLEFIHPDCGQSWWGSNSWWAHSVTRADRNRSLPSFTQQDQGPGMWPKLSYQMLFLRLRQLSQWQRQ